MIILAIIVDNFSPFQRLRHNLDKIVPYHQFTYEKNLYKTIKKEEKKTLSRPAAFFKVIAC